MLHNDFLMKIIASFGALARKLLKREDDEDHEGALEDIQNAYDSLLGLDPMLVATMDVSMLTSMLQHPEHLGFLARLVGHEAIQLGHLNSPHAGSTARKARQLYAMAEREELLDADGLAERERFDARFPA